MLTAVVGVVPDDLSGCPAAAVARLAVGLAGELADAGELLAGYGGWKGRTRRDHRVQVLARLGWRSAGAGERKQLDGFLLARALEHDAPGVLLQLACDWLRRERIVRPSLDARARIGMPRLRAARRAVEDREPRDHGHLDLLAARYKHLRSFIPAVVADLPLTGTTSSPPVAALLNAVSVLRELNRTGRINVPDHATAAEATTFVPARWRSYLDHAQDQDRGTSYRHYWELAVLYGVQAGLRSGDVWVSGSRRYTDPATLLVPADTWVTQRNDFCTVTGTSIDPTDQLRRLNAELHAAVADLERILADPDSEGLARLDDDDGALIVSPLAAEQLPADVEALASAAAARLPRVNLPSLLIEVDRDTAFTAEFTHAGGAQPRNPDLARNLYAALIAYACNLGYAGMADASGISEDALAWTSQWYLRQDTLRAANTRLVNAHHRHPLAQTPR